MNSIQNDELLYNNFGLDRLNKDRLRKIIGIEPI